MGLAAGTGLAMGMSLTTSAMADDDTVKVGILHSLSGTMAISETSLRDVLLYAFDEINTAGGIKVGDKSYKIEPVVVDGASNWPLFAEKAKQLLEEDKVAVTFGCWTSVSRKSVTITLLLRMVLTVKATSSSLVPACPTCFKSCFILIN